MLCVHIIKNQPIYFISAEIIKGVLCKFGVHISVLIVNFMNEYNIIMSAITYYSFNPLQDTLYDVRQ